MLMLNNNSNLSLQAESISFNNSWGDNLKNISTWYGRKVKEIFKPIDATTLMGKGLEILARSVRSIALIILSFSSILLLPMVLLGMLISSGKPKTTVSDTLLMEPKKQLSSAIEEKPPETSKPSEASKSLEVEMSEEEQMRRLNEDYVEIEKLYNEILKNLELIATVQPEASSDGIVPQTSQSSSRSTHLRALQERIESFKNVLKNYRGTQSFSKPRDAIAEIEFILPRLQSMYENYQEIMSDYRRSLSANLHYYEPVGENMNANLHVVKQQPSDGNCWLHSALFSLREMKKDRGYTHETLRESVVAWMRANVEGNAELANLIEEAILTYKEVKARQLEEEMDSINNMYLAGYASEQEIQSAIARIQNELQTLSVMNRDGYFQMMSQLGSHGSRAELYVISKIFEVDVWIWRALPGGIITKHLDLPITSIVNDGVIHVVLTEEGNHFNSRVPDVI